ncbi:MAG: tagatose 1,6-diphosphate aldolase [Armatimonadota bacterium]
MAQQLSNGKVRNLNCLADRGGRFRMLAIDQRGALQSMLSKVLGVNASEVGGKELTDVKRVITRVLAPCSTAVLTDPVYGYPATVRDIPGDVGLLLAHEQTGYQKSGPNGRERRSRLLEEWSAERSCAAGANAAKLLIYYNPDASEETLSHQQNLVRSLGEECARLELAFLLEVVTYPLEGSSSDSVEFACKKPDLVIRSAAEFSKPEYKVDVLKLEFPADLKYTYEYARGAFDRREREPTYDLKDVENWCARLDQACQVPWVILSAGVDIEEFLANVELAVKAGASGFLCGRAIWKDAVNLYPNTEAMESHLRAEGIYNFLRCNAAAARARPWYEHRRFTGG